MSLLRDENRCEMVHEMKIRNWNIDDINLNDFEEVKDAYSSMLDECGVEIDDDASDEDGLSFSLYVMNAPKGGSSHYTFRKAGCQPITIPKHEPIKKVYVEMVKQIVESEAVNDENAE